MSIVYDSRRYLTDFDTTRAGNVFTDVLVIGSGVAGASAALEAAESGPVIILTKDTFLESATRYAQGGIASALDPSDSIERHYDDTIRVGCGLNRKEAVRLLVSEGPRCIEEMIRWGMEVDRRGGGPALGREGGHSTNRIVHAHGDQTGLALATTLAQRVAESANIRVFEKCFLLDLITHNGVCRGATTYHPDYGHQIIWARQTVLASGGCGRMWRETTNPPVATGDGLAAAFRAGARLRDMEFMQFHPTSLYVAGAARALISEAVRGEGGHLVDRSGARFMNSFHSDGELAPRDVVSRAIHSHMDATRSNCVYLDVRHIAHFGQRFPFITKLCRDFQIDVTRDRIPVRPSAHYMIGGVEAGLDGTTSIAGLLACGEAACTGVHGGNRLASNSLLEGLVFGRIAGRTARERAQRENGTSSVVRMKNRTPVSERTMLDVADVQNSLRSVMWRNVGVVRHGERLAETEEILSLWAHYTLDKTFDEPAAWELQNQITTARLVTMTAAARNESVGVHFRADCAANGGNSDYHHVICPGDGAPRLVVAASEACSFHG